MKLNNIKSSFTNNVRRIIRENKPNISHVSSPIFSQLLYKNDYPKNKIGELFYLPLVAAIPNNLKIICDFAVHDVSVSDKAIPANKLDKAVQQILISTKFDGYEVTRGAITFNFKALPAPIIKKMLTFIKKSDNKRKTYSWIVPLQDLYLDSLEKSGKKTKKKAAFKADGLIPSHPIKNLHPTALEYPYITEDPNGYSKFLNTDLGKKSSFNADDSW